MALSQRKTKAKDVLNRTSPTHSTGSLTHCPVGTLQSLQITLAFLTRFGSPDTVSRETGSDYHTDFTE